MDHTLSIGRFSLYLLALVLFLQCTGIIDHSLWTPDEPREAEIVREMSLSGDYLIPHLAGRPFLEKPPLYYLTATLAYNAFGERFREAGRFASALFGLATLLMIYLTARRLYSEETANLAVLILATFPLFFLASHKMLVDVGLVFFIAAAMCSFILAYKGLLPAGYKLFWLSAAFAFLTKGIIGIAIPGAGIIIFILWQRDLDILKKGWLFQGVLLILSVMITWGFILYLKGGYDYLDTFYIHNQLGRFIPSSSLYKGGHVRPFYFYLKDVPIQAAPWSILLIPGLIRAKYFGDTERFLCSWLLGGLILLSLATTKREIYFLPMYPAMAIFIAHWMSQVGSQGHSRWERALLWCILALILAVSIALPIGYVKVAGGDWILALGLSLALAGIFWFLWVRYHRKLPLFAVLCWTLTLILWAPALFPQIDQKKNYEPLFIEFGKIVSNEEVIGFNLTETVEALGPFYGGFPVVNIEDRDQFINVLKTQNFHYVIVLPSRMDERLYHELSSRSKLVHKGSGGTRRGMELWRKASSR